MTGKKLVAEAGKQEVIITRILAAPRELVLKVYTDPKLIAKWCGQRSLVTTVDKMDVRPGGIWRFVHRDADGDEYAFHGVFHEIMSPKLLVCTFEFEGMPGQVSSSSWYGVCFSS